MSKQIHVVHVGGRSGIGPVNGIPKFLKKNVDLTIIEAFLEPTETITHDKTTSRVGNFRSINACLWSKRTNLKFNVMISEMASSLYPPAQGAWNMVRPGKKSGDFHFWGDTCKIAKQIDVETTTLDILYPQLSSHPDFLSLDIQGAEYETFCGATRIFNGPLLGIVSELEMLPLYEGQPLFAEQFSFLRKHGFIFFDFCKSGKWHWEEIKGNGALVWAEALWLRDVKVLKEICKERKDTALSLVKLAAVCLVFDRLSYAYHIVELLLRDFTNEFYALLDSGYYPATATASSYNKNTTRATKVKLSK